MRIAIVMLPLLVHVNAASLDPSGGAATSADDAAFLESLLGGDPGLADGGQTSGNPTEASGADTQPGKVKCSSASDLDSLTSEEFLLLLAGDCDPAEPEPDAETVQTCERGEFQCTPYHRCREEDIYSDGLGEFSVRIGLAQFEREQDIIQHSECPRFGDVCCSDPLPPAPENLTQLEQPYEPQCGRRNQEGLGLRIAGFRDSETQFGEFPWVVIVLRIDEIAGEERLSFVCAGSLVSPQLVLTAAHTVDDAEGARLIVRLGEWDTQNESELYLHEDVDVSEIKIHPEFHPRLLRDDVALLVLSRPVELRPHIDTICLPAPKAKYGRADCVTAGWGKDALEDGQFQTVLKKVDLPHVPRRKCQKKLRKTPQLGRYFRLDRSFTCAGGLEGEDACRGDGGAPLACRDPQQPDRWVQLGVVSWGVGCGTANVPGVYADVRPHVTWIGETIGELERQQRQNVDLSVFERTLNVE